MRSDAPLSKVDATRGYGAEIVTYDRYEEDREAIGEELARERGLELVKPYDDPLVMAGQGTAALELLEDAGHVDTLVTPVGGGGLIAGSATIARELGVRRVVGVEPAAGDDWRQSFAAHERVRIDVPRTIADGLQTTQPGLLTWEVGSRLVDEIVTVTDEQIVEAMRFAFERLKLVVEPSGAVGIAAVREGLVGGGRIGVIVSGGNGGADRVAELLAGLARSLGDLPRKRHVVHRDNGMLLTEEVMGFEGFSGLESILYHLQSPCRVIECGEFEPIVREEWVPAAHAHRHLRTWDVTPGGDAVGGRQLLMWNNDVEISICRPSETMDAFFRNGEGDEVIFVHEGSGTV